MKLIAIEPLKCGGKRVAPGGAFEADDKVGRALIDSGAAEAPGNAKVKAEAEAKVKAEAEAKVKAEAEAKVKAEAEASGG